MTKINNFDGKKIEQPHQIDTEDIGDENLFRGLSKEINKGVTRFWAKRGTIDPSKRTRGFGRKCLGN